MLPEIIEVVKKTPPSPNLFSGLQASQPEYPENIILWGSPGRFVDGGPAHHHRFVLVTSLYSQGKALVDDMFLHMNEGASILIFPFQFHHYADVEKENPYWMFTTFELADARRVAALKNTPVDLSERALFLMKCIVSDYNQWTTGDKLAGKNVPLLLELYLRELLYHVEERVLPVKPSWKKKNKNVELVENISRYIMEHLQEPIRIKDIADRLHISESHLRNSFKETSGIGLGAFIRRLRINRACSLLADSESNVSEVAALCGFDSIYSFTRTFKNELKTTPTEYRRSIQEGF